MFCCFQMQTNNDPLFSKVNVSVEVFIENVNDNPPNFAQSHYVLQVNEVRPSFIYYIIYSIRHLYVDLKIQW